MLSAIFEMSFFEIIGLFGVLTYIGSYAAIQLQFLDCKSMKYPLLNFTAASCVLISLIESFNLSSALIQISWITISLFGIARLLIMKGRRNNPIRVNPEAAQW